MKMVLFMLVVALVGLFAPRVLLITFHALAKPMLALPMEIQKAVGRTREKILNWPGFSYLGNSVGAVGITSDQTLAETQRNLETALPWVAGSLASTRLPLDTVLRGVSCRLSGTAVYTFASSPQATQTGTFNDLVARIEVMVAGGRLVKSVEPHILHMQQLLSTTIQGERKASAAAAAAFNSNPTADGGFVYGTSTQTTTVAETVYVPFEMVMVKTGRDTTWLNTKGLSQADFRLYGNPITSLDLAGNATFTSNAFTFEINTVEARDYHTKSQRDWRQSTSVEVFSSQSTDRVVKLNAGNRMAGISFSVWQNSDNSNGTAANRSKPNNNSLKNIKLRRNGREIYSTTFQTLQAQNRARFGTSAPFASNISRLDGFAYLDLTTEFNLETAMDLRYESGINTFEVLLTTNASDATGNIYPIAVHIEQGELVKVL